MKRLGQFPSFTSLVLLATISACMPMAEVTEGQKDLGYLKSESKDTVRIAMEMDYSSWTIDGYGPEEEYIEAKKEEYDEAEDMKIGNKPADGELWEEHWEKAKKDLFIPTFKDVINEYLDQFRVKMSTEVVEPDYRAIVEPKQLDPGYYQRLYSSEGFDEDSEGAELTGTMKILEAEGEGSSPLTVMEVVNAKGGGVRNETRRIATGFSTFAREFGRYVRDELE